MVRQGQRPTYGAANCQFALPDKALSASNESRLTKAKLRATKPEIIVFLARLRNKPGGQAWAPGDTWTADYGIEGINRRWDFDGGRYAFILSRQFMNMANKE